MIKIIIISHKRPIVTTLKSVVDCPVCIPESQEKMYRKANPNIELITHPDNIIGLSPKRQWIYEKYGDVFMLDDDITSIHRVYIGNTKKYSYILKPQETVNWIYDLSELARQLKITFFGFNRGQNPRGYSGCKSFGLNEFITGGAFGIHRDKNLFFPKIPYFVGEDYFINGLNAYYNRKSLIDRRISVQFFKTEANPGGCADYRTVEKRKETYLLLKKYFGDSIVPKKVSGLKKILTKYEKTLKIPY